MNRIITTLAAVALVSMACTDPLDPGVSSDGIGLGQGPAVATACADHTFATADLGTLCANTEGATFLGGNPDRNREGLVSKVVGADIKLTQDKPCDAIGKLTDFADKIQALRAQRKIANEPVDLVAAANSIIAGILAANPGLVCE